MHFIQSGQSQKIVESFNFLSLFNKEQIIQVLVVSAAFARFHCIFYICPGLLLYVVLSISHCCIVICNHCVVSFRFYKAFFECCNSVISKFGINKVSSYVILNTNGL